MTTLHAVTHLVATTAHAMEASLEMASAVKVCNNYNEVNWMEVTNGNLGCFTGLLRCTYIMQISMNVMQAMEAVNRDAVTPLVASTAAVTQATGWTTMDSTAMVCMQQICKFKIFMKSLNLGLI